MQKVRKLLCLLLCAAMLMSMSAVCFAANNKYSSWFKTNYDEINQLGLMPASFNGLDLTKDITRGEMCELAVYAFEKATGNDIDLSNESFTGFTDTNDEKIVKAHLYGIVNGYEDGTYKPTKAINRQEMAKVLYGYDKVGGKNAEGITEKLTYTDVDAIGEWAIESVTYCTAAGYLAGSNGAFNPTGTATRAMGAKVLMNMTKEAA